MAIMTLAFALSGTQAVRAQVLDPVCQSTPSATICKDNTPQEPGSNKLYGPNGILTKIANILSMVVGVVALFVIIIGAIRFVTASGDINKVNSARDSVLFAVIGLVVAALAQSIVIFVLNKL